jgi:hypothetical protein
MSNGSPRKSRDRSLGGCNFCRATLSAEALHSSRSPGQCGLEHARSASSGGTGGKSQEGIDETPYRALDWLADRLSAFLGFDVEEMKRARERHKIAYYIGIVTPLVMVVVAVVMQFARR